MNEERTLIDQEALMQSGIENGVELGFEIEEFHMEGDIKVVDKIRLENVSFLREEELLKEQVQPFEASYPEGYDPTKSTCCDAPLDMENGLPMEFHDGSVVYYPSCTKCGKCDSMKAALRRENKEV